MLDKLNQEEFKRYGLLSVRSEPGCSADFIFVSCVGDSLKNGRTVIYVSASRSYESFRIASNKMSVRLDAQRFHYVELSNMIAKHIGESTKSKLLERIDNICGTITKGQSVLVVLDNIPLIADEGLGDEIGLIVDIQRRFDQSLIAFGTCRDVADYCFRIPLQFNIKRVGTGFGKKINGQLDVASYRSEFDTLPATSSFHYSIGERSIQMFYPGTATVL